jgi:hypothetical protein
MEFEVILNCIDMYQQDIDTLIHRLIYEVQVNDNELMYDQDRNQSNRMQIKGKSFHSRRTGGHFMFDYSLLAYMKE